ATPSRTVPPIPCAGAMCRDGLSSLSRLQCLQRRASLLMSSAHDGHLRIPIVGVQRSRGFVRERIEAVTRPSAAISVSPSARPRARLRGARSPQRPARNPGRHSASCPLASSAINLVKILAPIVRLDLLNLPLGERLAREDEAVYVAALEAGDVVQMQAVAVRD